MKLQYERRGRAVLLLAVCLALLALASGFMQSGTGILSRACHQKGRGRRRGVVQSLFSGIVEQMGHVARVSREQEITLWNGEKGQGMELEISKADVVLDGAYDGCSIAVNGVCLTVTSFKGDRFVVGCAPETLRRTNLVDLKEGELVNLERSLPADGRNSGHMVQGHVDGTGEIVEKWREQDSLWIRVKAPAELMPYIVTKGYIAVDGTSLTVCDVNREDGTFTFMLIPFTQQHIIVPKKAIGQRVNLEVDVLAKYMERSIAASNEELRGMVEKLSARVAQLEEALKQRA